jgi:hypothetical protein
MILWHEQELEREFRKVNMLARAMFASQENSGSAQMSGFQKSVTEYLETLFPMKASNKEKAESVRDRLDAEAKKVYEVVVPEEHQ